MIRGAANWIFGVAITSLQAKPNPDWMLEVLKAAHRYIWCFRKKKLLISNIN
jgi:hypothetical protein